MSALVSAIIPTWNRAAFVGRAVMSVDRQDCIEPGSTEIIVVDDGSTDETPSVIEKCAAECRGALKYLRVDHLGKPGSVRNVGLEVAEGKYVAYCDSDDFWLPHHLITALQYFRRDDSLAMVSNYWARARFTLTESGAIINEITPHSFDISVVNTNCRVHLRECIREVGMFSDEEWGEDQEFFSRIEERFKTAKTGIVSSVNGYIRGGNNITYKYDAWVRRVYF